VNKSLEKLLDTRAGLVEKHFVSENRSAAWVWLFARRHRGSR
jgi:hypothetical protein